MSTYKSLCARFFSGGLKDGEDLEAARKMTIVYIVVTMGILCLVPYGCYSYLTGAHLNAALEGIAAAILLTCFVGLRATTNYAVVGYVTILIMVLVDGFLFVTGGTEGSGPLWSYMAPFVMVAILGGRAGSLATAGYLLFAVGYFVTQEFVPFGHQYSLDFRLKFGGSFAALAVLAYFLECIRIEFERRLAQRNQELEAAMKEIEKRELALKQSEWTIRELVERSQEGIVVIQDKLMKLVNKALADVAGYSVKEVIDTPFTDHVADDDVQDLWANYLLRMANATAPESYTARLKRKDGSLFSVTIRAGKVVYRGAPADLVFVEPIEGK